MAVDTPAETDEELPWWDVWENVVYLAYHLATMGEGGWTLYTVFTQPWEFSIDWGNLMYSEIDQLVEKLQIDEDD